MIPSARQGKILGMLKLITVLSLSLSFAQAAMANYEPGAIYRAMGVAATEHCHNTEHCPAAYVQVKRAGGLVCAYTIYSAPLSPVKVECSLGRGSHEDVFRALKVESSNGRKAVGGLICEFERSFWGGGDARCVLRK